MHLPTAFRDQMKDLLRDEFADFHKALHAPPPVSIRLHPQRDFLPAEQDGRVKWYSGGIYLPKRPVFTLDPAFHAGAYYVQEASSMLVGQVAKKLLEPDRPIVALDLAAAPGGKSTLLAEVLPTGSLLIANEVIRSRYATLRYNHVKWGYPNVLCSNHDPADFAPLAGYFDLLLLDAPCSGEGLFRKDPEAVQEWSPKNVEHCHLRQRRILDEAARLVKPGGYLLYSTCTYNARENRDALLPLLQAGNWERVDLELPPDWGMQDTGFGYQCYPHRLRGEGLFLQVLQKTGSTAAHKAGGKKSTGFPWPRLKNKATVSLKNWLREPAAYRFFDSKKGILALPLANLQQAEPIGRHLRRVEPVLSVGTFKGQDLVPAPELALSLELREDLPALLLEKESALHFLRGETLPPLPDRKGWLNVRWQAHSLGWAKALPNRINNYYPKGWRIRMG